MKDGEPPIPIGLHKHSDPDTCVKCGKHAPDGARVWIMTCPHCQAEAFKVMVIEDDDYLMMLCAGCGAEVGPPPELGG